MSKIQCLICGRNYEFLPSHLTRTHQISSRAYREEYDLAAGTPLASDEYRQKHAQKIRRMQQDGSLNYDHLPSAVEKSRMTLERPKRGSALAKQIAVIKATKPWESNRIGSTRPWEKNRLPPGAKRADGRDADRARIYQREYRVRKQEKS